MLWKWQVLLLSNGWVVIACVTHSHAIRFSSSVSWCTSYFQVLAIRNNVAVNTDMGVSFSSDRCPEVNLPDCMEALCNCLFWFVCLLFSLVVAPLYIPTKGHEGFIPISTSSLTLLCLFSNSRSDRCEVVSLDGFSLRLPDEWSWTTSPVPVGHLGHLWKNLYSASLPILFIGLLLFCYCRSSLSIFGY